MVNALVKRAPRSSARIDPIARIVFGGWKPKTSHPTEAHHALNRSAGARAEVGQPDHKRQFVHTGTTEYAGASTAMNSGQKNRLPVVGPVGREECVTAQIGRATCRSSGAHTGSAMEVGALQQQPVERRLAS